MIELKCNVIDKVNNDQSIPQDVSTILYFNNTGIYSNGNYIEGYCTPFNHSNETPKSFRKNI